MFIGQFTLGVELGDGATSQVHQATRDIDGTLVAIKLYVDGVDNKMMLKAEVDMLSRLDHPYVIKLLEHSDLDSDKKADHIMYIALELAPEGCLFDSVSQLGGFEEPLARFYFR